MGSQRRPQTMLRVNEVRIGFRIFAGGRRGWANIRSVLIFIMKEDMM